MRTDHSGGQWLFVEIGVIQEVFLKVSSLIVPAANVSALEYIIYTFVMFNFIYSCTVKFLFNSTQFNSINPILS